MSRALVQCTHRYDDGRSAWSDWSVSARYTGKPELEPCVARTCAICHHRDEYALVRNDDTTPEG